MKINKKRFYFLFFIASLPLLAFLLWPSPIQPAAWLPPSPPILAGELTPNRSLASAERLGMPHLDSAEDVLADEQGQLYVTNGSRIMRISANGKTVMPLVEIGGQNLGLSWLSPNKLNQGLQNAKPLNSQTATASELLVVANQPLGLFLVNTKTHLTKHLPTLGSHYANAVTASANGKTLYFTDSSSRYYGERWKYLYDLLEARPYGRLFALDLKTGKVSLLLDQLYYANGVALSPEEDYLLINETYRYRIRRFWLKGPRAGSSDMFADNLPGFPDGLSLDPQTGNYWAAMYTIRNAVLDQLHPMPFLKAQLAKLPRNFWPKPKRYGLIVVLSPQGKIIDSLQDPTGKIFAVSSARKMDNTVYFGSLHGGFAGRLRL